MMPLPEPGAGAAGGRPGKPHVPGEGPEVLRVELWLPFLLGGPAGCRGGRGRAYPPGPGLCPSLRCCADPPFELMHRCPALCTPQVFDECF